MNEFFKSKILESTGAASFIEKEVIQELWSGYGKIIRLEFKDGSKESLIAKHVELATQSKHARAWNTNLGHQRKVKSYQVETNWYQHYSQRSKARLAECITIEKIDNEVLILLEDLDLSGFHVRKHSITWEAMSSCIRWLAQFHACYLGVDPEGLWETGTYWHLDTRPEELEALSDMELKAAASAIDARLSACNYKTLVHGDAKLANFCFTPNNEVAGVDFQYVGGGCGMKDLAYFVGSCLSEKDCEVLENKILDTYFDELAMTLEERNEELEKEWRSLYRVAWADFHRFLKGWSPGHWKINSYSERVTKEVIKNL